MACIEYKGQDKKGIHTYRVYVQGPKKPDGSRNQIKRTFKGTTDQKKSDKLADKFALKLEEEVNKPTYREPTKETFAEHAERWLTIHGDKLQPKTLHRYKELLDRILSYIGKIEVEKIRMETVEDIYRALAREPKLHGKGTLSKATILHHHRLLHTILEYAVKRQLILANPCKFAKPDPPPKKEMACYNDEQVSELMDALEKEPLKNKVLVHLAISLGARAGEIQALKWSDVDFENKTIKINKSSQYIEGLGSFNKEPKNESSKRTVTVSASVIFLLRQLKGEQEQKAEKLGTQWVDTDSVFTTWNGKQIHPTYASAWWPKFISGTKLPPIRFHDLRHTCASLLLSKGQNPVAVAKRLGHSDTNTTLRVYAHAFEKDDFTSADIMETIITKKPEKNKQEQRSS